MEEVVFIFHSNWFQISALMCWNLIRIPNKNHLIFAVFSSWGCVFVLTGGKPAIELQLVPQNLSVKRWEIANAILKCAKDAWSFAKINCTLKLFGCILIFCIPETTLPC